MDLKLSNCSQPETNSDVINSTKKDDLILKIQIENSSSFKEIFRMLRDVVQDCNIVFRAPNNEQNKKTGGIYIIHNVSNSILINLTLHAHKFKYFRCDEPELKIGINLSSLSVILDIIDDNQLIILSIKNSDRSKLYIKSDRHLNITTSIKLDLMDLSFPDIVIPKLYETKITLLSDDFYDICKKIKTCSNIVKILQKNNEILISSYQNDTITISYKDTNYYSNKENNTDQIIQGLYNLHDIMKFRCQKLCDKINIFQKSNLPLVLFIDLAQMGHMFVYIAPVNIIN
jgi:hypothetical protein